ncbi:nibrin [Salmo salar]|uniref:Nibrin n=1 Tax=Salmo salar TaxID=8030 RepID=A0ABM3ECK9_SALSA|nr:nibrin [Salmo salar]
MWTLNPLESGGVTHYLLPGKEYVVGRKNCEVILPNDQSISRAHAHLTATDQALTLKDSSKYGTFVNKERLSGDTPRSLTAGDRVTFGVFHSKFSVQQVTVVVCSSCVDNEGKVSLSQTLQLLGGRLTNTWTQDCTHLVMPTVKVTIKTICALLCCRPIVKQEFFTELTKALQQKQPPPKAESFFPEIDEPSLNKDEVDLTERPERKELFTGKTFLFLNAKQQKRLSLAVSCGGGRSQLLEEGSVPVSLLESPLSCVIGMTTGNSQALLPPTTKNTKKWADSVGRILQRKGLRFITESEIGLAAIYVSCDKYCNPSNQMADSESMRMKPTIPGATLSQNAPVDETVMPAASQNITAYAVNTEPSQGISGVDVAGVSAVGETPERNQSRTTSHLNRPKPSGRELAGTCTVAETMMSSFSASDSAGGGGSDRKKGELQHPGGGKGDAITRFLATAPRTNGGVQTMSPQKRSSQKQQVSQKGSPQKQSALTNFFQPVGKKRPREGEESPTVPSEAKLSRREEDKEKMKRTVPQHSETSNPPHTGPRANTAQVHICFQVRLRLCQRGSQTLPSRGYNPGRGRRWRWRLKGVGLQRWWSSNPSPWQHRQDLNHAPWRRTAMSTGKTLNASARYPVPGAQGLPNIIGGSDLLAHNRGKNSELEEWLRDAAEDERQNKKEETLGDDLFRYNPKPTKKR